MGDRRPSHRDELREWRDERVPRRELWHRAGGEGWQRGQRTGGFGSQFDAWRSGVGMRSGFGFGPDEAPGGYDDGDWQVTRPARGRGTWAGDWAEAPARDRWSRDRGYAGRAPRSYRRADPRIYEDICERLTDDSLVDATDVTVRVDNGDVTLSGTVPTRDQKWHAEECVDRVGGVRQVFNHLRAQAR
jgi:hypothetical protein